VQELLVASFSESHGVRAEVEVVAAGCAFGVIGVLDVYPALLVVHVVQDCVALALELEVFDELE